MLRFNLIINMLTDYAINDKDRPALTYSNHHMLFINILTSKP